MNLKSIIAKVKLTNKYPYNIPNTNIVLLPDSRVSIGLFNKSTNLGPILTFLNKRFLEVLYAGEVNDTYISPYIEHSSIRFLTYKTDDFLTVFTSRGSYHFLTDDFVCILSHISLSHCCVWVINRRDFNSIVLSSTVLVNKIPLFKWGTSGLEIFSYIKLEQLSRDEFKDFSERRK